MLQGTNLRNATENLKTNAEELELMKDFSTTTEVGALAKGCSCACCTGVIIVHAHASTDATCCLGRCCRSALLECTTTTSRRNGG